MNCDRCHQLIKNFEPPSEGFTSGYYDMSGWPEFANQGEIFVCDWCIHTDQRYLNAHGWTPEQRFRERFF